MSTNVNVAINVSDIDLPYGESGVTWVDISLGNDRLIFSAGSDVVKNGENIPSSFQLSQAGVLITGVETIVPHYFLADLSDNLLKECTLMSNGDKRYVLAFDFDGATTSEPTLEFWDNSDLDTVNSVCLGGGTPSASWIRGITTTDSSPGDSWTGSRLAGSSDGHFLWLNSQNGALESAKTLYCNLYVVIPSTQNAGGAESPVMYVKYTSN